METRVIKKGYEIPAATQAWIRSHFEESELYPGIDPFHRVYRLADHTVSIREECSAGGSDLWIHLIIGEKAALLMDTGFGVGDLRGLVRHLIGERTLYVVNSHEHGDHVMGNCQFDRVWCHPRAVPFITKRYMGPDLLAPWSDENGNGKFLRFTKEDVIPHRSYELAVCQEGDVFDLGGVTVEVIDTPGHAAGGISFLDRSTRILFTGALHSGCTLVAGNQTFYHEYNTVEACLEGLVHLAEKYGDAFERVFAAHELPYLDRAYIDDEILACREILADRECGRPVMTEGDTVTRRLHTHGTAGLYYTPNSFR